MKFSGVFVILSVLFAISFAVPAKWDENDELMASDDNEVPEKRFVVLAFIAAKAKKAALGAAIRYACNRGNLSDRMKGLCACGSMIAGDEEAEPEESKRGFGDALSYLKSKARSLCNSKWEKYMRAACQCLKSFI